MEIFIVPGGSEVQVTDLQSYSRLSAQLGRIWQQQMGVSLNGAVLLSEEKCNLL